MTERGKKKKKRKPKTKPRPHCLGNNYFCVAQVSLGNFKLVQSASHWLIGLFVKLIHLYVSANFFVVTLCVLCVCLFCCKLDYRVFNIRVSRLDKPTVGAFGANNG